MKSSLHRRSFLRVSGFSGLLSTLPWLPTGGLAGDDGKVARSTGGRKCILIWLDGGPSHLETFDPKPEAAAEVRGPLSTIATNIPGVRFSECLPGLAERARQFALIRTMTSPLGEHNLGTHYLLTGYKPTPAIDYPAFSTVSTHLAKQASPLPPNVAIPNHRVGGSNFSAAGFLGQPARPFDIGGDPAQPDFRISDLDWYPSLDADRVARRQSLLDGIENLAQQGQGQLDPQFEQAFRLLRNQAARRAFDLGQETAKVRARYGPRSIGQSCLLARRLLESGVQFITINSKGWDTHDQMVTRLKEGYAGAKVPVGLVPSLDQAVSALIDDLQDRGLWQDTLVVVMGEFGRTPKLNVNGGRDHWPRAFSVLLAGGPIAGGTVLGKTDAQGESPDSDPVTPPALVATIYRALGIDHQMQLESPDGRPIAISAGGQPLKELLSL